VRHGGAGAGRGGGAPAQRCTWGLRPHRKHGGSRYGHCATGCSLPTAPAPKLSRTPGRAGMRIVALTHGQGRATSLRSEHTPPRFCASLATARQTSTQCYRPASPCARARRLRLTCRLLRIILKCAFKVHDRKKGCSKYIAFQILNNHWHIHSDVKKITRPRTSIQASATLFIRPSLSPTGRLDPAKNASISASERPFNVTNQRAL
jgi:hypothetical protein